MLLRQLRMCTVAEGLFARVFALTQPSLAGFFRLEFQRFEGCARVGAVAEGLFFRGAAHAEPVVFSFLKFDDGGFAGGNGRFI